MRDMSLPNDTKTFLAKGGGLAAFNPWDYWRSYVGTCSWAKL